MNHAENPLPVASETEGELAALNAQDDGETVPLRKEAATAGLLPVSRAEETNGETDG